MSNTAAGGRTGNTAAGGRTADTAAGGRTGDIALMPGRGRVAADRAVTLVVNLIGLCVVAPLVLVVVFVVGKGYHALGTTFFTQSMDTTTPLDPATAGGALHAIIGTVEQVALAIVVCVPLGLATALYLTEVGGRLVPAIRFLVDAMSGIPSIVAGLFIYTTVVLDLHDGFSGLAASLALSLLMLPTVTRTSEEMLRLVPGVLKEAALALGAPRWRTSLQVVLPAARTGLVTAVILGTARILGETAPLLLTSFGTDSVNADPLSGAQSSLPIFIYQQVRTGLPNEIARAWTGALVLLATVLVLFLGARLAARPRTRSST